MRLLVVGSGYVGLVAGACFAESGHQVTCCDHDPAKITALEKGEVPFYEPGLEDLLRRNLREGRLRFSTETAPHAADCEVCFLCVGTPSDARGEFNTDFLFQAAKTVIQSAKPGTIMVSKSTVPVGTCDKLQEMAGKKFAVVANPEFLKEGNAVEDFMKPDRVVIGCNDEATATTMKKLYAPFVRTGNPVLVMAPKAAEMSKLSANAFLAMRVSFMNEIARLCECSGADVRDVRIGMGADSRIGHRYLFPGIGFGGSCFPKDLRGLLQHAQQVGVPPRILQAIEDVNQDQRRHFFQKIEKHFGGKLTDRTIAIWGLAFKPNTDDIREAPALSIIDQLLAKGAKVAAYDPEARERTRALYGNKIRYADRPYDALQGADALCLITEWNIFRHPDYQQIKSAMKSPVVFDGRNIYDPKEMKSLGFTYYSLGTC